MIKDENPLFVQFVDYIENVSRWLRQSLNVQEWFMKLNIQFPSLDNYFSSSPTLKTYIYVYVFFDQTIPSASIYVTL